MLSLANTYHLIFIRMVIAKISSYLSLQYFTYSVSILTVAYQPKNLYLMLIVSV